MHVPLAAVSVPVQSQVADALPPSAGHGPESNLPGMFSGLLLRPRPSLAVGQREAMGASGAGGLFYRSIVSGDRLADMRSESEHRKQ